jgi:hypothetical protein
VDQLTFKIFKILNSNRFWKYTQNGCRQWQAVWSQLAAVNTSELSNSQLGKRYKTCHNTAVPPARVCSSDESDDSDSSLTPSSTMGQSPGTCGSWTALRNSAPQQLDSSKEWIFQGNAAFPNLSKVDWDDVNDPVPDEVRKGFTEVGELLKASFSENSPAEIEYIVIISYIAEVSCDVHQSEVYLHVDMLLHSDVLLERSGRLDASIIHGLF